MPLNSNIKKEHLLEKVDAVYKLIPVLCKGINQLTIDEGDNVPLRSVRYKPETICSCSDSKSVWLLCRNCNVLVFETRVSCGKNEQTFSLVFNIECQNGQMIIKDFYQTPFLWHTMPTQETWQCKYVFNGFFELNPGRTHINLQDTASLGYVSSVGESFGLALCELYEHKGKEWSHQFWSKLWSILAVGLNDENHGSSSQTDFLKKLHLDGKGLSVFTKKMKIVSSGLSSSMNSLADLSRADAIFINKNLMDSIFCEKVIPDLLRLLNKTKSSFNFIDIKNKSLITEIMGWDRVSIEEINDSRTLYTKILTILCDDILSHDTFRYLSQCSEHWPEGQTKNNLRVHTQSGEIAPIKKVLINFSGVEYGSKMSYRDEYLRAKLAPTEYLLDERYLTNEDSAKFYIRLRGGYEIDANTLVDWILVAEDDTTRNNALKYLYEGDLRGEVQRIIQSKNFQSWINDFNTVKQLAGNNTDILMQLFPQNFQERTNSELSSTPSTQMFHYKEGDIKQIEKRYENRRVIDDNWPADFLGQDFVQQLKNNEAKAWCPLLLLGSLQSIGRRQPVQHKGFIETLRQVSNSDLWQVFTEKNGYKKTEKWMESLDLWFDNQTNQQEYSEWMNYFVSMYQINRYFHVYSKLFVDLPRVVAEKDFVDMEEHFSIRANSEYSGAGRRFDAPPLPLKIGRFWVVRELARLNFEGYRNEKMWQYCWIPKEKTLDWFGVPYQDNDSIYRKYENLIDHIKAINNGEIPNFNYNFDLAITDYNNGS